MTLFVIHKSEQMDTALIYFYFVMLSHPSKSKFIMVYAQPTVDLGTNDVTLGHLLATKPKMLTSPVTTLFCLQL